MPEKNDMTLMYAMHNALRRELDRLARATSRPRDDPKHVLRTALGWQMFKSFLHVHHGSEDDKLWPVMRAAVTAGSSDAALLDAMEAEHAEIDPLLRQIDAALGGGYADPSSLGELTDALRTAVRRHLDHEEGEALPLVDATVNEQQSDDVRPRERQARRRRDAPLLAVDARRHHHGGRRRDTRRLPAAAAAGVSRRQLAGGVRQAHALAAMSLRSRLPIGYDEVS